MTYSAGSSSDGQDEDFLKGRYSTACLLSLKERRGRGKEGEQVRKTELSRCLVDRRI